LIILVGGMTLEI